MQSQHTAEHGDEFTHHDLDLLRDSDYPAKRMLQIAEQGEAIAQFTLGGWYREGLNVPQNDVEAVKWYRHAAEQGFSHAQLHLARMYYVGKGIEKDEAEAMKWYRLAAEQGDAEAQYSLGCSLKFGCGRDDTEATKWMYRAAKQGLTEAQSSLGDKYYRGEGVSMDYVQAYFWLNLASTTDYLAEHLKTMVAKRMTKEQIAEAKKLSREFKPKKGIQK